MTNGMIISPPSTFLTYVVISQFYLQMVYIYIYRILFDMQKLAQHTISFWLEAV
jgi:hypothetical protein